MAAFLLLVFTLALAVLLRESSSPTTRTYLLFVTTSLAGVASTILFILADDPALVESIHPHLFAVITLLSPTIYQLAVLAGKRPSRARLKITLAWSSAACFMILHATHGWLFTNGVYEYAWGYVPKLTGAGLIWLFYKGVLMTLAALLIYRGYRDAAAGTAQRNRCRVLLIVVITVLLGGVGMLPSLGIAVPPILLASVAVQIALVTYVAIRYGLGEITPTKMAFHVLDTLSEALLVIDSDQKVHFANPAAKRLFNCLEPTRMSLDKVIEDPRLLDTILHSTHIGQASQTELPYTDNKGGQHRLRVSVNRPTVAWSSAPVTICVLTNLSENNEKSRRQHLSQRLSETLFALQETNSRLRNSSSRDPLTNLYNRRHMEGVLDRLCYATRQNNAYMSLVLIRLEPLHGLRVRFTEAEGNTLLRQTAIALEEIASRPSYIAARLGEDLFALALPNTTATEALHAAHRAEALIKTLTSDSGTPYPLDVAAGIATLPAAELGTGAAQALLYQAETCLQETTERRRRVLADRTAIDAQEDESPLNGGLS
ncbi:diguanylate cyclase [Alkalilimnicola ehrlichii]|nr:GGDEF domain-containing protein [Alkalilimnicola ehrlichii]